MKIGTTQFEDYLNQVKDYTFASKAIDSVRNKSATPQQGIPGRRAQCPFHNICGPLVVASERSRQTVISCSTADAYFHTPGPTCSWIFSFQTWGQTSSHQRCHSTRKPKLLGDLVAIRCDSLAMQEASSGGYMAHIRQPYAHLFHETYRTLVETPPFTVSDNVLQKLLHAVAWSVARKYSYWQRVVFSSFRQQSDGTPMRSYLVCF